MPSWWSREPSSYYPRLTRRGETVVTLLGSVVAIAVMYAMIILMWAAFAPIG